MIQRRLDSLNIPSEGDAGTVSAQEDFARRVSLWARRVADEAFEPWVTRTRVMVGGVEIAICATSIGGSPCVWIEVDGHKRCQVPVAGGAW